MANINQQVIADRLGISRATVSRCFTNHAGISPHTRAKVFQLAAELGYTHMIPRSPSAKGSKKPVKFCVLICSDPEEYFRTDYESPGEQILAGVSEYAQTHNASVDVHLIPPDATDLTHSNFEKVDILTKRQTSGILLIYPFPPAVLDQLALQYPLVSLVDQLEHNSIDCVDVDHYNGISTIVDHLVDQGHQRIGFYTKNYAVEASWSFRRYSAFIEKMARHKFKTSSKDIIGMFPNKELTVDESIDEVAQRTAQGTTAWVCAADHQAYDVVAGLKNRGLNVPEEVSVTGFDGIVRTGAQPNLTTIQIPYREIGMTGAERLDARLRKRFQGKQHVYISGLIRPGKTVAPPPT